MTCASWISGSTRSAGTLAIRAERSASMRSNATSSSTEGPLVVLFVAPDPDRSKSILLRAVPIGTPALRIAATRLAGAPARQMKRRSSALGRLPDTTPMQSRNNQIRRNSIRGADRALACHRSRKSARRTWPSLQEPWRDMAAYPRAYRPNHCRSILTTNAVKARNALKSGHRYALCRDGDILLGFAACDYQHLVIRQRALQRLRLIPWRPHPNVALFLGRQDHGHGLGMYRLDDRVRRRRQKAVDQMRTRDRF